MGVDGLYSPGYIVVMSDKKRDEEVWSKLAEFGTILGAVIKALLDKEILTDEECEAARVEIIQMLKQRRDKSGE